MRILIAPDKFKGTFTAAEICRHLRAGMLATNASIEVISHPLADGGEGTLDVLLAALGGTRTPVASTGPLGDPVRADVGRLPDGTAVIESALFCGTALIAPERRNPLRATTYGLGTAVREVLSWKPARLLIGLGGSATVDGGLGMARALGYRILAEGGKDLPGCGADLLRLVEIRAGDLLVDIDVCPIEALCDVATPLSGPEGAALTFAPQKGASAEEAARLDAGLQRLESILERDLGARLDALPGAGAAGGVGAAVKAFLGAELTPGARRIMALTGFERRLPEVDLVVTGEGECDLRGHPGKVVAEVIDAATLQGVPVFVVCGRWTGDSPVDGVQVIAGHGVMGVSEIESAGKRLVRQAFSGTS